MLVLRAFFEKVSFWKMGIAGIKWEPYPSTIHSYSINLNEEAVLKVSFKNIDKFQSCPFSKTTFFFKKGPKSSKKFEKFHFWLEFCRAFQWYIVCLNTLSGYRSTEGNIAVSFQLATTVHRLSTSKNSTII